LQCGVAEREVRAVSRPIEEDDLQAWVDGRLGPEHAEAVQTYFAAHPEARERWSQYAGQREELRAAFAERAAEPMPARLCVARLMAEQRRRSGRRYGGIAAAAVLLMVGGIAGWGAHDLVHFLTPSGSAVLASSVFDDAIAAHRTFSVEVRHPVEVGANEEAHLVQWLSKRLGHQLIVPDLGGLGFRLMGGRLLPADSGPAALFMYENGNGSRLSCYYIVTDVGGETEFKFREQNGISAFYWVEDGLAYAIAANAPRDVLLKIAELVYQQNSPSGAKAKLPPPPAKAS
jgi:anti-sigma factor RsiW